MSLCYDFGTPATSRPGFQLSEHPVKCPYCGNKARKATGKELYPHRKKLWKRKYFACIPCDAYVGCHVTKGHKWKPFGPLANKALRRLRMRAHDSFDRIWKDGFMTRPEAYNWLCEAMGLSREETHIGMFNEEQCRVATVLSGRKFADFTREGCHAGQGSQGSHSGTSG